MAFVLKIIAPDQQTLFHKLSPQMPVFTKLVVILSTTKCSEDTIIKFLLKNHPIVLSIKK